MGMKRIPATLCRRVVAGRTTGLTLFLILGTVVGAGMAIYAATGNTITVPLAWSIVSACLAIPLVGAFVRGKLKPLPDSMVDEMGADVPYTCAYCTREHLHEACEMTKPYYAHEYVSGEVAEQWRSANPTGFVELLNKQGELCACFGVLALTDSFRDQFIAGRVTDTQMRGDCILGADESKKSATLYISGVVVRDPSTYLGSKRAFVMVWAIVTYLKNRYGVRKKRTLIAIAANKQSEQFMQRLGFTMISPANQREDKCSMYSFNFSRESAEKLICQLGDMSPMCKWQF